MYKYVLRSFDGRHGLPQTFTSLAEAKKAAKHIFNWNRCYSASLWQPQCDFETETYQTLAISGSRTRLNDCDTPVIERRKRN